MDAQAAARASVDEHRTRAQCRVLLGGVTVMQDDGTSADVRRRRSACDWCRHALIESPGLSNRTARPCCFRPQSTGK
jgi:hypothetical protein